MTTDRMPIWSIEIGDTILVNGDIYAVIDADYADDDSDLHVLTLIDEEGSRKQLRAPGSSEVKLIVTEYV